MRLYEDREQRMDIPLLERDPPLADTAHPNVFRVHREDRHAEQFEVGLLLGRDHRGCRIRGHQHNW